MSGSTVNSARDGSVFVTSAELTRRSKVNLASYEIRRQSEIGSGRRSDARKTKMNFVEAHHLVPMQFQERFEPCLDVLENVVVLCPTCHRKLHHGQIADKKIILTLLHQARDEGLKSRGLEIGPNDLVALFKGKLEDE
jgi:5-methylcytosine-specific restriction protein A